MDGNISVEKEQKKGWRKYCVSS